MQKHLFLYLDILGFTELLRNPNDVEELYETINGLNVFDHGSYECIVFSDTMLIYDPTPLNKLGSHLPISVMWLCEFAQNLLYSLISTDIHFRALLTTGEFKTSQLKNFQYFYGKALVDTHSYEKNIQSTGLYIHKGISVNSTIFKTTPYDTNYHYVFLNQNMNEISDRFAWDTPAGHANEVQAQGLEGLYVYDFIYLKNIHRNMNDTSLPGAVRTKYLNTWHLLSQRYAALMSSLVSNNFDPSVIIDLDWSPWIAKLSNRLGYHG